LLCRCREVLQHVEARMRMYIQNIKTVLLNCRQCYLGPLRCDVAGCKYVCS
jgi:hypothetical protein